VRSPVGQYLLYPKSDQIAASQYLPLWATFWRTHPQQKQQAIPPSDRGAVAPPASATVAWPLATHARQSMLPVIGDFRPLPHPKRSTHSESCFVRSP
jgi:hypothetical protein